MTKESPIRYLDIKQAWFSCLLLFCTTTVQAQDVAELLSSITNADTRLNYEGVFVLRKSDNMMTMRVVHAADDDGVRESLEFLNGEVRRVIRDNESVLSIYPDRGLYTVSMDKEKSSLHPALPANLEKLRSYYQIERLEDDRIADRAAVVVELEPMDEHRYGYRYWVDTETGVLLRCDLIGSEDSVIEQMMFTQLEYPDELPSSSFEHPGLQSFEKRVISRYKKPLESAIWRVTDLPSGFMLTQSSHRSADDSDAVHLVFSDGLASVSVFIESGDTKRHYLAGSTSMGALNAYGLQRGDVHITVMGEVPEATVEQIARSTAAIASRSE